MRHFHRSSLPLASPHLISTSCYSPPSFPFFYPHFQLLLSLPPTPLSLPHRPSYQSSPPRFLSLMIKVTAEHPRSAGNNIPSLLEISSIQLSCMLGLYSYSNTHFSAYPRRSSNRVCKYLGVRGKHHCKQLQMR